jgi:hypothetical protein
MVRLFLPIYIGHKHAYIIVIYLVQKEDTLRSGRMKRGMGRGASWGVEESTEERCRYALFPGSGTSSHQHVYFPTKRPSICTRLSFRPNTLKSVATIAIRMINVRPKIGSDLT